MSFHMDRPQTPPPLPIVFWVIWFAILSGLLIMQFFAGGGVPASDTDSGQGGLIFQGIALALGAAALFVRFGVIPKLDGLQKKLPAMIVGLALAEGVGILGIFVVPHEHESARVFMLSVSIACIVVSMPVYAKLPSGGTRDG